LIRRFLRAHRYTLSDIIVSKPTFVFSGPVAYLELWERSEVLFPSFPLHTFLLPCSSFPSFPSPLLPYLVAIISMIFLRINLPYILHFFASLLGGTLPYHGPPCPDIIWGNGVPHKIFGGKVNYSLYRLHSRVHEFFRPRTA